MKISNLGFRIFTIIFSLSFIANSFAQEDNKLVALSKQIIESKTSQDLYAPFESLKVFYFKDNKYSEFVDFLKSLEQKKKTLGPFVNYYIALSRYTQLKYLEEKQLWDEYFAQGNNYRDELTQSAQNAISGTTPKDAPNIYSRLILWQFHKNQQDAFLENSLSDLMASVLEYSKSASGPEPIKEVADKLLSYQEKGKSKELYKLYAEKLLSSGINDEGLSIAASGFYKEGNLELAQNIYDVYIDRITKSLPKEKSIPVLIDITKSFAYKDDGSSDAVYAEKIFSKIEELSGKGVFDQELMYLRAFNLEKAKDYPKAKDVYNDLILKFPETSHSDEAVYKEGVICTYVLKDINQGRIYFEKLAQKTTPSSQVISSLYQLGLLSQWENDFDKAKSYYNKLIEQAAANFADTVTLARQRLKEIEEAKPLEYNLKTFIDVSLKKEYSTFDMTKLDLKAHPYSSKIDTSVSINSTAYTAPTGCMQVELQYLWSGDLGTNQPSVNQPSFDTTYTSKGTKEINLIVVSPTGIIDRSFDLVDVY